MITLKSIYGKLKLYCFRGLDNKRYILMPGFVINGRIIKDSRKSNNNWVTNVNQLMSLCKREDFPEDYAINIKIKALNVFHKVADANIFDEPTIYNDSIYYAYNSLANVNQQAAKIARSNYLKHIFKNTFITVCYLCNDIKCPQNEFYMIYEEWMNSKFSEYYNMEQIDFASARRDLAVDLIKVLNATGKVSIGVEQYDKLWNHITKIQNEKLREKEKYVYKGMPIVKIPNQKTNGVNLVKALKYLKIINK